MFIRCSSKEHLLKDDAELDECWTRHDGASQIVSLDARPLILLRDGTIFRPVSAQPNKWLAFYRMCRWEWKGQPPNQFDIIGYQVSD